MDTLPHEIIEYILINPILSFHDVVNFSSTCSQFRELVNSSRIIWQTKYFQRWPKIDFNIVSKDWYKECATRRKFEKRVVECLEMMATKFFHVDRKNIDLRHCDFLFQLLNSTAYGYYYFRDVLISIRSLPLIRSLTHKYYGNILLKFINKKHYQEVWNNLLKLNAREQILEKGAIFVSLWCQEDARGIWLEVTSELDNTANLVKQHLLQNHKDHPLKNVPEETLSSWRSQNIPGNMFEPNDCKEILWSINYVLFEQLKYRVMGDLKDFGRKKCGIDHALLDKRATPLIFAVIYESVARRLGVKVEVLDFQAHCLLKWREHYNVDEAPSHYINMDSKVLFIKSRCPRRFSSHSTVAPCNMQQVAERAALYIYPRDQGGIHLSLRDALELLLVIKPYNLGYYLELSRSYMLHEMDSRDLISKLLDIRSQMSEVEWRSFQPLLHSLEVYQLTWEHNFNSKSLPPQSRDSEVAFAVGMIVRDEVCKRTGVIYGWNKITGNPHRNGKHGSQVFYKMLVDDGSYQYVPQKNLDVIYSPPLIHHPSIGRFFDEYCSTHYKPNKQLLAEYPGDMEVLQTIFEEDRQA